ncbi:MAG: hypothetical protein IJV34_01010 [Prevotella sp.]|nr:hypothetical protein [Prevotella sp.]
MMKNKLQYKTPTTCIVTMKTAVTMLSASTDDVQVYRETETDSEDTQYSRRRHEDIWEEEEDFLER